MRWALLGAEKEMQLLTQRFSTAPELNLVLVSPSDWESLLARDDVDAVVVAPGLEESLRTEQLKKLVGAGITVVAVHPAVDVLTAYEIEAIRRDAGGTVFAFAPGWRHPAWDLLCDLISLGDSSPLGRTELIGFERYLINRQRDAVLTHFNQDVHVVRRFLGNITSVNAVGAARDDGTWSSLSVHFTNDQGCAATWSIAPPNAAGTRINVSGSQATASLLISGAPGDESWELNDSVGYRELFPHWDDTANLVEQLSEAAKGKPPTPRWSDTCLDLEVAETAEKSLRRKRAIDLHTTERSEEKTFKGVMAAAGCLVLLVILIAFLGLALWDGFRAPFRDTAPVRVTAVGTPDGAPPEVPHGWPLWARLWPVYPVFAFLLLQLLLFITRPQPEAASGAGS